VVFVTSVLGVVPRVKGAGVGAGGVSGLEVAVDVRRQALRKGWGLGSGIWELTNHSLVTSSATLRKVAADVRRQGKGRIQGTPP
jgi:hypothetical protein